MIKIYTITLTIAMLIASFATLSAQSPVTTRSLTWNLTGNKNWPTVGTGNNWDNKANWVITGTTTAPTTNVTDGDKIIIPNIAGVNILITTNMTITYNNLIIEIDGAGEIDIQAGADLTLSGAKTAFVLSSATSSNGLTLQARASTTNPTQLIMNGVVKALNATTTALAITSTTTTNALSTSSLAASTTGYGGFMLGLLPVVLSDFNINLTTDKKVTVSWTTQQEVNSDHFEIERSNDGMTWQTLVTIKAAGYSSLPVKYNSADASPIKGTNFYRLRIVDIDGKTAYSQVKNILLNTSSKVRLYPNPSTDFVNISLGEVAASDWTIAIINNAGQVVTQRKCNKNAINANIAVNMFPNGNYTVQIVANNSVQSNKIMINHP